MAETQPPEDLTSPAWLLAAVAVCLPVCLFVFWRIGRWWSSDEPVPLPLDGAWPAVRWPPWYGMGLFVLALVVASFVPPLYEEAAGAGLVPWEPLAVPHMFSPGVFLSQILPSLVVLLIVAQFGRGAIATVTVRCGSLRAGLAHGVIGFATILPVCVAALVANMHLVDAFGWKAAQHPLLEIVQHQPQPWVLPLALVQAAVLAPLAEEFLYRGVLMTSLLKGFGVVGAIVLSSAIFASMHLPLEPQAFLPLFFLGMGLAYVAYRTRSLVAPIVMHALFNALMILGTFGKTFAH